MQLWLQVNSTYFVWLRVLFSLQSADQCSGAIIGLQTAVVRSEALRQSLAGGQPMMIIIVIIDEKIHILLCIKDTQ